VGILLADPWDRSLRLRLAEGGRDWVGHLVWRVVDFYSNLVRLVVCLVVDFFVGLVGFRYGAGYRHGGFVG